jgi:hypothetical protein
MIARVALGLAASVVMLVNAAQTTIEIGEYARVDFSPVHGESFHIPLRVARAMDVELKILTSDGDLVRTLKASTLLSPGSHEITWDGRDDQGKVVPDEAYIPVLVARTKSGETVEVDPRTTSGGEVIENIKVDTFANGDIGYSLPAPARVLVRVGIKEGPMMLSLANWEPRAAGRNVQRWNGYDADQLVDLRASQKLGVLVTAFKLPAHAIITTGNTTQDYRAYRLARGWSENTNTPSEPVLERNGQRLSRTHFLPRFKDRDPLVALALASDHAKSKQGLPLIDVQATIRVDIPREDRWLMQESLYEVAFFVDNEFVSEEEHGYVPFTWVWKPVGLQSGRHVLTVNISGFGGKVGVKNLLFEVP